MKVTAISQLRKKRWYENDGEQRLFLFRDVDGVFYYQTESDIKSKKLSKTLDADWWLGSRKISKR